MRLTKQQKHEGIIDVFLGRVMCVDDIYMSIASEILNDDDYDNDIEIRDTPEDSSRIMFTVGIEQVLDEDDYGGFIEEYFSVMITLSSMGGNFTTYSDVDHSHIFEDFDKRIGDFVAPLLIGFKRTEYSGLSFEKSTRNIDVAMQDTKKMYDAFNNLRITKKEIVRIA